MGVQRGHGHRGRGSTRGSSRRAGDRGATILEFALIAPVLFAILFAVIDFGLILKDDIGVEQGVREAARQGTVAQFGSTTSCAASLPAGTTTEMKKLVCLTKARSEVPASELKVAIRFDPTNSGLAAADAYPAGTASPPVGNGLIVCAIMPMKSTTGLFGPVVSGRFVRSKVDMRIEKGVGTAQRPTQETDPSGEGWAWCVP